MSSIDADRAAPPYTRAGTRREGVVKLVIGVVATLVLVATGACSKSAPPAATSKPPSLEGGWRAHVTFASGPLKGVPFQFLITYSTGGGMVESSNFDEVPPVPPAYGSWGRTGPTNFKSTYIFWTTKMANAKDVSKGWTFSGIGVLNENIALSQTGDAYTSSIAYQLYDTQDKPLTGQSGTGSTTASRIIVG
jgi:hypothetical protein